MRFFDYQSTARYVQYAHALQEIRRFTFRLGRKFLVLTGCGPITKQMTETMKTSFSTPMEQALIPELAESNHRYNRQIQDARRFDALQEPLPEVTFIDIDPLPVTEKYVKAFADKMKEEQFDAVIGAGGGKALDFARGAAYFSGKHSVLVPTSPSTNAAATQLFILRDETGTKQTGCFFAEDYPSVVLADTSVLIQTAPQLFAAGVADQLCSYYECLYSARHLQAEKQHNDLCWEVVRASVDMLLRQGKEALESVRQQQITPAFENVLSCILHNQGMARSVSGSGFSHLLGKVLESFAQCGQTVPHGLQVGYGIIPMMTAEGESLQTIAAYLDFCEEMGIPMTLRELHLENLTEEALAKAAEPFCSPSAEVPFDAAALAESVMKAEAFVQQYKEGKNREEH